MKRLILAIAIIYGAAVSASAGTTVSTTLPVSITGLNDAIKQFQNFSDNYGPSISNAYALGNISGYPVGSANLGAFPHFTAGISANAGLVNMQYFDTDVPRDQNKKPAVGLNPTLFIGLGLGSGWDFMGKLMVYSNGFYNPPLSFSFFKLDKLNLVSVGGKLRYNAVKKKTIIPRVFNFGGITLSGGADMLYGLLSGSGKQKYTLKQIDFGGTPYDVNFDANYSAKILWYIVSLNAQALAYIDFLFICSFYTGFGMAGNYGYFHMTANATGTATVSGPVAPGTIIVDSNNKYGPYYLMPVYIVGFDINLYLTRLSFESMVNMRNGRDINVSIGARYQY